MAPTPGEKTPSAARAIALPCEPPTALAISVAPPVATAATARVKTLKKPMLA